MFKPPRYVCVNMCGGVCTYTETLKIYLHLCPLRTIGAANRSFGVEGFSVPTQVSTVAILFRKGDPSFTRVNSSQDQFSDGREVLPPVYSKFLLLQSAPIVFMLWKEMTSFCLPGVRAAST